MWSLAGQLSQKDSNPSSRMRKIGILVASWPRLPHLTVSTSWSVISGEFIAFPGLGSSLANGHNILILFDCCKY